MIDAPTGPSKLERIVALCRQSPMGVMGVAILVLVTGIAIFAPLIAPYDPLEGDFFAIRQPPSSAHWLGTDDLGRDVLSRIIYGARTSLLVGFTAVLIGDTIGFVSGVISGYLGGKTDLISQRVLEVILAFPGIILATVIVVALGSGLSTVIIAIAVARIPASNRVVRAVVLSVKNMDYTSAAKVAGASPVRIMMRHIAPQTIAPFLVIASAHLGIAITSEAALSFLGIGIPPPSPSWGTMIGGAISGQFRPPWWLAIFPGIAITITVFAANVTGDAMRDYLDPNLRNRATTHR